MCNNQKLAALNVLGILAANMFGIVSILQSTAGGQLPRAMH